MRTQPSKLFWWITGFVATTAMALLSVADAAMWFAYRGEVIAWRHLAVPRLLDWYTCAVFFPPLIYAIRRWPIDREHLATRLPLHLGLTLLACVGKIVLFHPIQRALYESFDLTLGGVLAMNLISEATAFGAVVAVIYAVEFYLRYRERERLALQLQARLSDAQLRALRAQLNPHFLFNTLNAATTLLHRDPDAADRMLTRLGELLRLTMRADPEHETPLCREMDLLERYLSIMRVRFYDRVTVHCDIDPDVTNALVPSFILQPIVENAFEHGIARLQRPGRVDICALRQQETLVLLVKDDGPGPSQANGSGLGLANTRHRLSELHGAKASLELRSVPEGGGTIVEVRLPLKIVPADSQVPADLAPALVSA